MIETSPSYYAIIPANVRYDKNLCANAKLLYGEITALSNKHGYCYASNAYFAKLYDVSNHTISRWVSGLAKGGYIRIEVENYNERKIFLVHCIEENDLHPETKKDHPQDKIVVPLGQKGVHNTTENNTSNNTENKETLVENEFPQSQKLNHSLIEDTIKTENKGGFSFNFMVERKHSKNLQKTYKWNTEEIVYHLKLLSFCRSKDPFYSKFVIKPTSLTAKIIPMIQRFKESFEKQLQEGTEQERMNMFEKSLGLK